MSKRRADTGQGGPPNKLARREPLKDSNGAGLQQFGGPGESIKLSTPVSSQGNTLSTVSSSSLPPSVHALPPKPGKVSVAGHDGSTGPPTPVSPITTKTHASLLDACGEQRRACPDVLAVVREVSELMDLPITNGKQTYSVLLRLTDPTKEKFDVFFSRGRDHAEKLPQAQVGDVLLVRGIKIDEKGDFAKCSDVALWGLLDDVKVRCATVDDTGRELAVGVSEGEKRLAHNLRKWWEIAQPRIAKGILHNTRMDLPLSTILAMKFDHEESLFRVRARVVSYSPPNLQDFVYQYCEQHRGTISPHLRTCPSCSTKDDHVLPIQNWDFSLHLEDDHGHTIQAVCLNEEATDFLGGLPARSLLERECPTLDTLRSRIALLTGHIEEIRRASRPVVPSDYAEWCIRRARRGKDTEWVVVGSVCSLRV